MYDMLTEDNSLYSSQRVVHHEAWPGLRCTGHGLKYWRCRVAHHGTASYSKTWFRLGYEGLRLYDAGPAHYCQPDRSPLLSTTAAEDGDC